MPSTIPSNEATTKSTVTLSTTPVVFSAIPVNIPSHSPEVDDSGIGAKRRLTGTDTNKRPSKFTRTDENTRAIGSIDTLSNPNTSDFPNFKTVGSAFHQLVSQNSRSRSNSLSGGERGLQDDDGGRNDSDDERLFGDNE